MKPPFLLFVLIASILTLACDGDDRSAARNGASDLPGGGFGDASEQTGVRVGPPADAPLVVFLGDSIAAGLHLPAQDAFPAVIQRMLAEEGTPFRLVNAGISGDTSAGGLRRLDWLLEQKPDIVVVELGANDGLRGQPLGAIEANLKAIVERIDASDADVLLLGMRIPTNYGRDYAEGFAALYERVAEATKVAFQPFFMQGVAAVRGMNLPDGIHPTSAGHRVLATNVAPQLERLLAARAKSPL